MAGSTVVQSLLVELDAKTVGLEAKVASLQGQLDKFQARATTSSETALGSFLKFADGIKPVTLTIAGATAAIGALAVKAVEAAEQADGAMRQIGANLPTGAQGLGRLVLDIDDVAAASGRARDEVRAAAVEIAKLGVSGPAEVRARLQAATELSDATGTDLMTTVQGLDQVMDLFHLDAGQAEEMLAKMASAAKGRTDIEGMFDAFRTGAPALHELGIDADTATKAIVALVDGGMPVKKVGEILKGLDASGVRELAAQARISASALDDLRASAQLVRDGADRSAERLKNNFSAALEHLGTAILPTVNAELEGMAGLIDRITHATDQSAAALTDYLSRLSSAGTLATKGLLDIQPGSARHVELGDALGKLTAAYGNGSFDPSSLSGSYAAAVAAGIKAELQLNQDYFRQLHNGASMAAGDVASMAKAYQPLLDALDKVIAKQAAAGGAGGAAAGVPGPLHVPLSQVEQQAIQSARDAATSATTGLSDQIASAIAGGTADGIQKAYDAFEKFSRDAQVKYLALQQQLAKTKMPQAQQDQILEEFASRARAVQMAMLGQIDQMINDSEQKWQLDMAGKIAALTGSAAQALRAELETLTAEFAKQGRLDDPQVQHLLALKKGAIDAAQAIEDVEKQLADFRKSSGLDDGSMGVFNTASLKDQLDKLGAMKRELQDTIGVLQNTQGNDERIKQLRDEIAKIEKTIADSLEQQDKLHQKAYDISHATAQKIGEIAKNLETVGRTAIAAAQALGLMDDKTAATLQNVTSLVSGIGRLVASGGTDPTAWAQTITSAAALIGSLLSGGKATKEQIQTLQANTAAVARLTDKIGLMGTNLSGAQAAQAQVLLSQILPQLAGHGDYAKVNLQGFSQAQIDLLNNAAKALGISMDGTAESYRKLADALSGSMMKLGEFSADFDGLWNSLQAATQMGLYGLSDPTTHLRELLSEMGALSPAIADLAKGLDLTNPDDLATLKDRIAQLFGVMQAGGKALSSSDLGSLTGDQLLQVLEALMGDLTNIGDAAQQAAGGVDTATQALQNMENAASALKMGFSILGTSAADQAQQLAAVYGFGSLGDLSTQAGVDAAIANLRALYQSNTGDTATAQHILDVIQTLQGIQFPAAGTGAGASGAAVPPAAGLNATGALTVTQQIQQITEATAGQMADLLRSIFAVLETWHTEWLAKVGPLLDRLGGTIVAPPQIPAAYLQSASGTGPVFNIQLQFAQNFYGEIKADASDLDRLGRELLDDLNRGLGKAFEAADQLTGKVVR